jgi:two-component system, cell cycle response regulator
VTPLQTDLVTVDDASHGGSDGTPSGTAWQTGCAAASDEEAITAVIEPRVTSKPGQAVVACLTGLSGSAIGKVFRIESSNVTIGRAPGCDIQVEDDGVSRRHVVISKGAEGLTLVDWGSTNGTTVNGERVETRVLADGDRVQIGSRTVFKFALQDELEGRLQEHLYNAAQRDALTQAYNRHFFEQDLARAFSFATRHRQPLSLLLLDIDRFKMVNDEFGHVTGDRVLVEVVSRCLGTIRNEDVLCRVGGEEFAVIARGTTARSAAAIAERLRVRVAGTPIILPERELFVTVSVGIAGLDVLAKMSADALYAEADRRLYDAKHGGRNAVCVAEDAA